MIRADTDSSSRCAQTFQSGRYFIVILLLLSYAFSVQALACSTAGQAFPDSITTDGNEKLYLNGVGSRTKLLWDVYVAALYLPARATDSQSILAMTGQKQIQLYFVRDVPSEKLIQGWRDGFELNQNSQDLALLSDRLESSCALFTDMKSGDRILFDLDPDHGVSVNLNGNKLGSIEGEDFVRATLQVWLGERPPQDSLKDCLLGKNELK